MGMREILDDYEKNVLVNARRDEDKRLARENAELRDKFALAWMHARAEAYYSPEALAERAYEYADALMEARKKP